MMRAFWRTLLACAGLSACASGPATSPPAAPAALAAAAYVAPVAPHDEDADGVVGPTDECPKDPGLAANGCPTRDGDADGVLDEADKCAREPGAAPDGCPLPDVDGDLVLDASDACQADPESVNGYLDRDGCPDEIPDDLGKFIGVIPGVEFDLDKDTLKRRSGPVLRRAATVLRKYTAVRIEISGHTTADGIRQANIDLSLRRAEAVKRFLVERGVEASRVETRGAGPDEPYGCCNTCPPGGRKKNRRIEFRLIVEWPRSAPQTASDVLAAPSPAARQ